MVTLGFLLLGNGVIGSIGLDGSNYREFKTGPEPIISFTQSNNILLWVTLDKGMVLCQPAYVKRFLGDFSHSKSLSQMTQKKE